ncbi:MAG: aminotransferase class V-fold PLP-dependent enzyme [Microthrixaceae bacterium]|nr:aminotransferase class V-fold PLP-dependent enzyme [Microthrixaceae bacterium]
MTRIYLDHASTSVLRPEAHRATSDHLDAMASGRLGDPARIHAEGMASRTILEDARTRIASWLGVRPRQIVFTSGATESITAAHHGARARAASSGREGVVLTAVEHSSVTRNSLLCPHRIVPVDASGRVTPDDVVRAVDAATALVHIQWANHESGVTQPVHETIRALRDSAGDDEGAPLVHVDAAQAGTQAPDAVAAGADLVSISGLKLGGTAGRWRPRDPPQPQNSPLLPGGDQERARRAGMENIAAVVGLAAVADHLATHGAAETEHMRSLAGRIIRWADGADGIALLGDRVHRAPHLVCLQLEGLEPQPVLLRLDQAGIAVHSGSSCSSEAFEPSPVLAAIGVDAQRSLRISVGWSTSDGDVDAAVSALDTAVRELRGAGEPT